MELISERYGDKVVGSLSCFDRVILRGSLSGLSHSQAATQYLYREKIKIFDYPDFTKGIKADVTKNAEAIAAANGLTIEYLNSSSIRKGDRIKAILAERGTHPGLVHIFSCLESFPCFYPSFPKDSRYPFLKGRIGKGLHYYFYFIDEELGLCYMSVSTWFPCPVKLYFNGHFWLANELKKETIDDELIENAFVELADLPRAQQLADSLSPEFLHKKCDRFVQQFCPIAKCFNSHYYWTLEQVEYAKDIIFKDALSLTSLYDKLVSTAVHTVKPEMVSTFLGSRLGKQYDGEIGSRLSTRIEGKCLKHIKGKNSIKMYDKFGHVLRFETTTYQISQFRHERERHKRDGSLETTRAPMKKSLYSLPALREILSASNQRYEAFISAIEDPTAGVDKLKKVTETASAKGRNYSGFNFFNRDDETLFNYLIKGEHNVKGFQNKELREGLPIAKTATQVSRILKRLTLHGLIQKVGKSFKYLLTDLGKQVICLEKKLVEMVMIPDLTTGLAS